MKKQFNPKDWLPSEGQPERATPVKKTDYPEDLAFFERALEALEASGVDITGDYNKWCCIGFALTHFGEAGREYFHRVSRMYPGYDPKECDLQYQRCLDSKGKGIGLGTLYHYMKEAGINIGASEKSYKKQEANSTGKSWPGKGNPGGGKGNWEGSRAEEEDDEDPEPERMPVFPDSLYERLPEYLKRALRPIDGNEERDIMLLGALTVLSSCLTRFYGIYDGKEIKPILYLFVTANASAGKGRLNLCRRLVLPIHKAKRAQAKVMKDQYDLDLAEYNTAKGDDKEKPVRPPEKMLFIPANSSATGALQLLSDNEGQGLIFESEGDTLSFMLRQDFGNYSDSFRKNFHHETISYYRRTDREYVDIESPCLATLLSGTPRQVNALIPSAENGLFSRFLFYYMNFDPVWKKVFGKERSLRIAEIYDGLGQEFFSFHKSLQSAEPVEVVLSEAQVEHFYQHFSHTQIHYFSLFKEDYVASVRRMGLIFFRLTILLTALRMMETGKIEGKVQCSDLDYELAMEMIQVLIKHSIRIYYGLPKEPRPARMTNLKEKFLDSLPSDFDRRMYLNLGRELGIPEKTTDRYVARFVHTGLVERFDYNHYRFPEMKKMFLP